MKVVIVGGVAGGATAAARLRRLDESADITIYERSGFVSYANCGLPYYIGGVITDREELTLQTPESFMERFRIKVRTAHEVLSIDPSSKCVRVRDLRAGRVFTESYDKLLLSPGATAVRPALPGIDNEKIFTLRTVEDTFQIYDFVERTQPGKAVIIGGGFIGIETAENLKKRGLEVTIIQRPKQLMNTLDYDMASFIHSEVRKQGIALRLGCSVAGFAEEGDGLAVQIEGERSEHADFVVLAIGVQPDSHLAKEAGLELGLRESIVVNDRMETSDPDIYAVGDAVQVKHLVSGESTLIALAGPANKQGRIAADNIAGGDSHFSGSMGSSIIKIFDLTAAGTGLSEKASQRAGIDFDSVVLSPASHASYYPGARAMTMKVVYERGTLRLLGAQIVGSDGVDKRIDVLATAIMAGLRADELKELDLCYAPPYSSAKDPVNMAGFMIENIATGKLKQYHWNAVEKLPRDESVTLLYTRTVREYSRGHVDGYINIPVDELRDRLSELDPSKPVYVMCQSGLRSYIACRILIQNGFDAYNFSGGYRFYSSVVKEIAASSETYPCGIEK